MVDPYSGWKNDEKQSSIPFLYIVLTGLGLTIYAVVF
jgi:hypothetical protein